MSDRPMNRRAFFRQGLGELLRSVGKAMEPLADAAKQFAELEKPPASTYSYTPPPAPDYSPDPAAVIRPPGARPGQEYLDVCSRCGECMRICPEQCIQIDFSAYRGQGAPYIDPETKPCTMCEGLMCTTYCPSGALLPILREEMKIGTAVWHEETCLRIYGQECTICIDKCPVGEKAIRLTEGRIEVVDPGCTGCGVCQYECPSGPKSITVTPRDQPF
jgi:ferredoxin-type protein NapG